jgi:hypothetical protein
MFSRAKITTNIDWEIQYNGPHIILVTDNTELTYQVDTIDAETTTQDSQARPL